MNREVLNPMSNEWVLLDSNADDGYLSPEEDGKIIEDIKENNENLLFNNNILNISFGNIDNNIETQNFINSEEDEIVNNILESEINIKKEPEINNILSNDILSNDSNDSNDSEQSKITIPLKNNTKNNTINITKKFVKQVPNSVWINIALHLLKNTSQTYDWRVAFTCSLASTTILIIRNRTIILNLTKFTIYNGIPFILDKTSCLKSYYFKKN